MGFTTIQEQQIVIQEEKLTNFAMKKQLGSITENEGKKYDLIAPAFADMRNKFYSEQKYLDLLIKYLQPASHILDVGCGSGHPIASYLIEQGFHVTGVDASKELLKIAEKKCPLMKCVYGDIRNVDIQNRYDAIVEWWCLFHLPKQDHETIIARCAAWLKEGGILEFTTGDHEYVGISSNMLNQALPYFSLSPTCYEKYLKKYGFKILLKESDQPQHLVWIAKK